jgi:hypothetical protein
VARAVAVAPGPPLSAGVTITRAQRAVQRIRPAAGLGARMARADRPVQRLGGGVKPPNSRSTRPAKAIVVLSSR